MTIELACFFLLIALIAWQQWQIQKLIDKLMSRSYTEYVAATKPYEAPRVPTENEPPEDLGALPNFSL